MSSVTVTHAIIHLARPATDGGGAFKVDINGREVAVLDSGDQVHLTIRPGHHRVRAHFAWISSEEFPIDVAAGDAVTLRLQRAWGFGPFEFRYFTQRHRAITIARTIARIK